MDSFWNSWAIAHRNAKAAITALLLFALLIWALYNQPPERIAIQPVSATVVKARLQKGSSNQGGLEVQLPDGRRVRLFVMVQPFPKKGETIPLQEETYADGSKLYLLDQQRWINDRLSH